MGNEAAFIHAVIGTEVLSLILCLVLLMGIMMDKRRKSKRARLFILLVVSVMTGSLADLLSWLLDGRADLEALLYFTTLCSMVMTIVTVGVFISYLSAYVSERKPISKFPETVGWISVAAGVIATVLAGATGSLFTFQDGCFSEKPLYTVYVIANSGYMLIGLFVITKYRKVLNRYDKLAGYSYMLIPLFSALIGLFVDGWDFSYPAIMVSLLILYIMLHSDHAKKLEEEGTAASYQASHDGLTGLYNRNAYDTRILQVELKEENCGVVFGDLNGLKYTNDTYGHEAGDRLLIRYAQILTDLFRASDIFRISGDEFICIIEEAPELAFRKRVDELRSILNRESPPLACIGAAYGSSRDIESIVREAEVEMYAGKKIIHERFPKTRRAVC